MKIIDRYVLRQFLKTFLICYVSLMGLYVVFEVFTNLEEFLRCGRERGGVLALVGSFYSYRALLFFDDMAGMLSLIAAMVSMAWIQRHNELVALMSAGVSRFRVALPVVGATIVVAVLAAGSRELVIPRFRSELARKPQDPAGDRPRPLQPKSDHRTQIWIGGHSTRRAEKRITEPRFQLPGYLEDSGWPSPLAAENAFWEDPDGARPGGYRLVGVTEPADLAQFGSMVIDGEPILITPRDARQWLKPNELFVVSGLSFDHLLDGDVWREYASTSELIGGLRNPSLGLRADDRVAIHARFVQPFLDVTLLFLGLPLVLARQDRNVFLAIGFCAGLVVVFMLVVIASHHLGGIYSISPALAAWLPLIIFVPIAVGMAEPLKG